MLCFVFAALIVALDQFFKHWVMRTLDIGQTGQVLIPGVLGLTRWENDGAMLNILSGQQWLLAGIAFLAAIVLVMILLRYNEGFWGTLGLAAVLGGTVGNLTDRIFNDGKVVDMFMTLFIKFPIFNIADIFITLGFLTFLIHFISISFKAEGREKAVHEEADSEYYDEYNEQEHNEFSENEHEFDEFDEISSVVEAQANRDVYHDDQYSTLPRFGNLPQFKEQDQLSEQPQNTEQAPNTEQSQYSEQTNYTEPLQYSEQPRYAEQPLYTDQHQYIDQPQYTDQHQYTEQAPYDDSTLYDVDDQNYLDSDIEDSYEQIDDTEYNASFSLDALELELGSLDDYDVDALLREYGYDDDSQL